MTFESVPRATQRLGLHRHECPVATAVAVLLLRAQMKCRAGAPQQSAEVVDWPGSRAARIASRRRRPGLGLFVVRSRLAPSSASTGRTARHPLDGR